VFTRALHWSLFWARSIQSIPSHPISLRFILILSTHLRLGLPSGLFYSGIPTNILYAFLFSPIRATCPAMIYSFIFQEQWIYNIYIGRCDKRIPIVLKFGPSTMAFLDCNEPAMNSTVLVQPHTWKMNKPPCSFPCVYFTWQKQVSFLVTSLFNDAT
jgi:hypothetical protein